MNCHRASLPPINAGTGFWGVFVEHCASLDFTGSASSGFCNWLRHRNLELEAEGGIEPTNAAFAEPCLTTWLLRRNASGKTALPLLDDSRISTPRSSLSSPQPNLAVIPILRCTSAPAAKKGKETISGSGYPANEQSRRELRVAPALRMSFCRHELPRIPLQYRKEGDLKALLDARSARLFTKQIALEHLRDDLLDARQLKGFGQMWVSRRT